MAQIARWTTPVVMYKPSAVDASLISEIYMVVMAPDGRKLITKDISSATLENGTFSWSLTQTETSKLITGTVVKIKIDYLCLNGMRYTTNGRNYTVADSAINKEI